MSDTEGSLIRLKDTELYCEQRGRGTPLLLLHGFTGSGAMWREIVKGWETKFKLIIPDLPSHGSSGDIQGL